MTNRIVYADDDRRIEVESPLMRESLINPSLRAGTASPRERGVMPDLDIVSLGGHSIIDRGAKALMPLVDVIVAARARRKLLIGAGGGARVRHTLHIGLSLGLPVGALANLVSNVDAQNAKLLAAVFARHRGVMIEKEEFLKLPLLIETGMIGARELLDAGFADLAIEPAVLENMLIADHVREVHIINGLVRGQLTRALAGEHVGTVIHA